MSMDIKDLQDLRVQLGIAQATVGQYLGVSRETVRNWENGFVTLTDVMRQTYEKYLQDVIDGKINPPCSKKAGTGGAAKNDKNQMTIKKLHELRIQLGISQEEIAKHLGVARSAIGHWETGRYIPMPSKLQAYGQYLQTVADGKSKADEKQIKIKELRELRVQLGISERTAAEYLGVRSFSSISAWENGTYRIPSEKLQAYELFIQSVIDGKLNMPRCVASSPVSHERMAQLRSIRQALCLTLAIVARHVPFAESTISLKEKHVCPTSEKDYALFIAYYKKVKLQRIFGRNYKDGINRD